MLSSCGNLRPTHKPVLNPLQDKPSCNQQLSPMIDLSIFLDIISISLFGSRLNNVEMVVYALYCLLLCHGRVLNNL